MLTRQDLAKSVRNAIRLWRAEGVGRVARIVLRLAASPFLEFGELVFFVRELDAEASPAKPPDGIELRLASASDLDRLVSGAQPTRAIAQERFRRGDRCAIAVETDGVVSHSRWVTLVPTPIPELNMAIRPDPDEAYFYDGYTRPEARGRGIDYAARLFIFDLLGAERVRRVYSYVRGDNGPGLRAASRCQVRVGTIRFLRIRGRRAWIIERRDDAGADHPHSAAKWPTLG
jgi:ribosomal protein S18 acetylase RimI-like enzyme